MQEIRIRQNVDNRIGGRVEKPVVIVERDLMESDEGPVPVQGHGSSDDGRQGHGQDGRQLQIAIALPAALPEDPDSTRQSTEDGHVFEEIENILYFFKMNAPAFRHGKRRKFQRRVSEAQAVVDDRVIIRFNLRNRIAGSFRNMKRMNIQIIQRLTSQGAG